MAVSIPSFLATDAQAYEHFMARWSRRMAGPFLDFVGAKAGDRVLDVGCGTGVIWRSGVARSLGWTPRSLTSKVPAVTDLIRRSSMSWATRVACHMQMPPSMPASRPSP